MSSTPLQVTGFGHQANSRDPRGFLDDGGSMEFLTDLPNLSCMLEDMPSGGASWEEVLHENLPQVQASAPPGCPPMRPTFLESVEMLDVAFNSSGVFLPKDDDFDYMQSQPQPQQQQQQQAQQQQQQQQQHLGKVEVLDFTKRTLADLAAAPPPPPLQQQQQQPQSRQGHRPQWAQSHGEFASPWTQPTLETLDRLDPQLTMADMLGPKVPLLQPQPQEVGAWHRHTPRQTLPFMDELPSRQPMGPQQQQQQLPASFPAAWQQPAPAPEAARAQPAPLANAGPLKPGWYTLGTESRPQSSAISGQAACGSTQQGALSEIPRAPALGLTNTPALPNGPGLLRTVTAASSQLLAACADPAQQQQQPDGHPLDILPRVSMSGAFDAEPLPSLTHAVTFTNGWTPPPPAAGWEDGVLGGLPDNVAHFCSMPWASTAALLNNLDAWTNAAAEECGSAPADPCSSSLPAGRQPRPSSIPNQPAANAVAAAAAAAAAAAGAGAAGAAGGMRSDAEGRGSTSTLLSPEVGLGSLQGGGGAGGGNAGVPLSPSKALATGYVRQAAAAAYLHGQAHVASDGATRASGVLGANAGAMPAQQHQGVGFTLASGIAGASSLVAAAAAAATSAAAAASQAAAALGGGGGIGESTSDIAQPIAPNGGAAGDEASAVPKMWGSYMDNGPDPLSFLNTFGEDEHLPYDPTPGLLPWMLNSSEVNPQLLEDMDTASSPLPLLYSERNKSLVLHSQQDQQQSRGQPLPLLPSLLPLTALGGPEQLAGAASAARDCAEMDGAPQQMDSSAPQQATASAAAGLTFAAAEGAGAAAAAGAPAAGAAGAMFAVAIKEEQQQEKRVSGGASPGPVLASGQVGCGAEGEASGGNGGFGARADAGAGGMGSRAGGRIIKKVNAKKSKSLVALRGCAVPQLFNFMNTVNELEDEAARVPSASAPAGQFNRHSASASASPKSDRAGSPHDQPFSPQPAVFCLPFGASYQLPTAQPVTAEARAGVVIKAQSPEAVQVGPLGQLRPMGQPVLEQQQQQLCVAPDGERVVLRQPTQRAAQRTERAAKARAKAAAAAAAVAKEAGAVAEEEEEAMEDQIGEGGEEGACHLPSKKMGGMERVITLPLLRQYYNAPIKTAAQAVGLSLSCFKKVCRKLGVPRWPARKLRCLGKLRDTVLQQDDLPQDVKESFLRLVERNRALIMANPETPMDSRFTQLRQAQYKMRSQGLLRPTDDALGGGAGAGAGGGRGKRPPARGKGRRVRRLSDGEDETTEEEEGDSDEDFS